VGRELQQPDRPASIQVIGAQLGRLGVDHESEQRNRPHRLTDVQQDVREVSPRK
jgi:hypothetical protein